MAEPSFVSPYSRSSQGTLIYINASSSIQTVLEKVEQAGGKIITPKM